MLDWFFQGGFFLNLTLTVLLVLTFIVAWKAPTRLREMAAISILVPILAVCAKCIDLFNTLSLVDGAISPALLHSTLKVFAIELTFGLSIATIATVLRFFTKPRKY